MEKMKENASQVEVKENWAKPELEIVSVKENTLGGPPNAFVDLAVFS
ncbi:hypothetical protein [Aquirufa ecclesiirivi]|uniref:Paeninodin family lasso peptide n=1 Tax=Aquirufa ecclesiirivi TaxID=2715124 RepID=A0ABT4JIU6_9BACT|nr:hypothetical protein [Aquirufa ecclesiirivi]MCZ2475898.1 hypothetical protein [Aquirufa ecclesiirivi]